MFSTDIAWVGAAIDAFNAGGAGPNIQATGFRIVPVLAAGATQADLAAAYSALQVRVYKQTKNFLLGTTELMNVAGPDWTAAVGMGRLELVGGFNPTTYRVWIATDCKEMEFVTTPVMNGFLGAGATAGGTTTATSEDQALTAAAPTLSSDGVSIAGARAVRISYKAKNAGATMNAAGKALAWYYSSTLSRWVRCPELDYDFAAAAIAPVEPQATGPAPSTVVFNAAATRLQYTSSGMTVSAGVLVTRSIEVLA